MFRANTTYAVVVVDVGLAGSLARSLVFRRGVSCKRDEYMVRIRFENHTHDNTEVFTSEPRRARAREQVLAGQKVVSRDSLEGEKERRRPSAAESAYARVVAFGVR